LPKQIEKPVDLVARLTVDRLRKNGLHEALGTMIQPINIHILVLGGLHFIAFLVLGPAAAQEVDVSKAAKLNVKVFTEPMVARVELRLTVGEEEVDVIEKGDLVTVLEEREKTFLVRTFRGVKGGIEKVNLVTLAESVETYDEIINKDPKIGLMYTLRAGANWARGAKEKAMTDFDQAIAFGYDNANAFSSRALFLTAIADYNKAIELTPDYVLAYQNRAWLLAVCKDEKLRDPKLAIESATKACELNQFNDLSDMAALAAAHAALKEFDKAIGIQEKIVERAPEPQKPLAKKILDLYRNEKPFDPDLTYISEPEQPVAVEPK